AATRRILAVARIIGVLLAVGPTRCGTATSRPNGKQDAYYACNGKNPSRGRIQGRCSSKVIRGQELEEAIWRDILAFLHDPGPILSQLATHLNSRQAQARNLEQERMAQSRALSHKE